MARPCFECEDMWRRYAGLVTTYTSLAQQATEPADASAAAVGTIMLIGDLDELRRAIDRHERDVHKRLTPWFQRSPSRTPFLATTLTWFWRLSFLGH